MSGITSYATALAATNGRDSKRIANNTYAERRYPYSMANPSVAIRFHKTDIVTYHPMSAEQGGEVIELNSGAWRTHITMGRINAYLPEGWNVTSTAGIWDVSTPTQSRLFLDGISFDVATGEAVGNFLDQVQEAALLAAKKELKKKVKGYVALVPEKVDAWRAEGSVSTAGDCLYCQGIVRDARTNDVVQGNDHLWAHLNEGYIPLTLVIRAYEYAAKFARGGEWDRTPSEYAISHIRYGMADQIVKYLRKYLLDQLDPINRVSGVSATGPDQQIPERYLEWAKAALQTPEDYGYYGSDDTLYVSSAPSWTRTRDSESPERANFLIVEQRLIDAFPELWGTRVEDADGHTYERDDEKGYPQIYIMRSGHWAVGWIEQIVVPVWKNPNTLRTVDNLHPAWVMLCQIKEQTELYPYLDGAEEMAAEMDTTDEVEDIERGLDYLYGQWGIDRPDTPTAAEVLWEIQVLDDEYGWTNDQVIKALGSLAHAAYLEEAAPGGDQEELDFEE